MSDASLVRLYQGLPGTTVATVYTATQRVIITEILLANTSATAVTATVYVVPSGGSAGDSNTIVPTVSLAANSTVILELRTPMHVGDTIQAKQGTADKVCLTISGEGVTV